MQQWLPIIAPIIAVLGSLGSAYIGYQIATRRAKVDLELAEREDVNEFYKEELRHCREQQATWMTLALKAVPALEEALEQAEKDLER